MSTGIRTKNFGTGAFTEDLATAPSFRLYDYSAQPAMNNGAVYLEDNVLIPIGKTRLNIIAGLRGEGTFINGSEYGNTYSLSPRVSAKYVVLSGKTAGIKSFAICRSVAVMVWQ